MSKLLQLYIGGVWRNDYSITWGGGMPKWLQYYIGVVCPMITILHRGGLANDYGIPWILGFYIRDPEKWLRNMCTTPKGKGDVIVDLLNFRLSFFVWSRGIWSCPAALGSWKMRTPSNSTFLLEKKWESWGASCYPLRWWWNRNCSTPPAWSPP